MDSTIKGIPWGLKKGRLIYRTGNKILRDDTKLRHRLEQATLTPCSWTP